MSRCLLLSISLVFLFTACQSATEPSPPQLAATSTSPSPVSITGTYTFEYDTNGNELKASIVNNSMMRFEILIIDSELAYLTVDGTARLDSERSTATYTTGEDGSICEIVFNFGTSRYSPDPAVTIDTLQGDSASCGYGDGGMADGTYTISGN